MSETITHSPGTTRRQWGGLRRRKRTHDAFLSLLECQEEPIRADLFSLEQLRRRARALAHWHRLVARPQRDRLLPRLHENARILEETYRLLDRAAAEQQEISPAGQWLLDNYYLIHDQIRMARQHLPRKYSMELPQLAGGAHERSPRVYDLALELISHVDGQSDPSNLEPFVEAYQAVTPLTLGELWAVPIMLRLALIENLRRTALRLARQHCDRQRADIWANRLLEASREPFEQFLHVVGELTEGGLSLRAAFVARLTQRLQGRLAQDSPVFRWLRESLADKGHTLEQLIHVDMQNRAADQISMDNSISSLRSLDAMDWKEFVEDQSVVDRILRQEASGLYPKIDFTSRDRYRHVIESLARRSGRSEADVARAVVDLARKLPADIEAATMRQTSPQRHIGYYLVDRGRALLEKSIGYRPLWRERIRRAVGKAPLAGYFATILTLWLATLTATVAGGWSLGLGSVLTAPEAILLLALAAAPAGQLAVNLGHWFCTLLVSPRPLMRLDFSEGIPANHRALVAIPTLLTSADSVRRMVEHLELRYLANRDDNLLFALVTDFPDAPRQTLPGDERLLETAKAEIRQLNARYTADGASPFYLLHRPRQYNPREGAWMGYERKRGKLVDLNRLLRTGERDAFSHSVGDLSDLASVRYVITLDSDTLLPHGVARELVGCMAHPLNRPRIDPRTKTVVEGYGILQPRVATTIPDATRSIYSRLFTGDVGIDPYTRETSDVYQDLFGQGSFIGKGIYDVEAFETALEGRFPENRVLSHDLIESCFARSGLVSDVELFEGFPSRLLADMSRRHRWIRGDWQIAAWLGPRIPKDNGTAANPLSALARWKIFDNLRRSVTPIASLGFLLLGWTVAPAFSAYWVLLLLLILFASLILTSIPGVLRKPEDKPWGLHLRDQWRGFLKGVFCEGVELATLPYTVHCHIDAIARTLYRLNVSRRKLLEWTTASDAEVRSQGGVRDHYEVMWTCTVAALAAGAWLTVAEPWALPAAGPLLLLWLLGPAIAWDISQPQCPENARLTEDDVLQIRRWARRAWHYFDVHCDEAHHGLPPDNMQEYPQNRVAKRTSPTNIGLGLLAHLAAYDFGYLPPGAAIGRIDRMLRTMGRMERYRGHFYNWYDTHSLQPLEPRYVSTVDSGNLAGALVALEGGLKELHGHPVVSPELLAGIRDTLGVLDETYPQAPASTPRSDFAVQLDLARNLADADIGGSARRAYGLLGRMRSIAAALAEEAAEEDIDLTEWAAALLRQCDVAEQDLASLAFWTDAPSLDPGPRQLEGPLHDAMREFEQFLAQLDTGCTLRRIPEAAAELEARIQRLFEVPKAGNGSSASKHVRRQLADDLAPLQAAAERAAATARERLQTLEDMAERCRQIAAMDFRFLYHPKRKLLAIGFDVGEHRRDRSYYDLLASESRLTSYVAISQGQLPEEHWFLLGRMVTTADHQPVLLSWAGSMFEYLMPMLLMPSYCGTLLEESCRTAVRDQIRYAQARGVPWGISESCYHRTDAAMGYHYRAFGVPGLGLKRGLGDDLVIAPYASAMSLMLAPREACANLRRLQREGHQNRYGFYDAIDYTPRRGYSTGEPAPCRTVMAHHSAMSLLAFAKVLLDEPMQRRFLANPLCKAHDLLLQERLPQAVRPVAQETLAYIASPLEAAEAHCPNLRVFDTPHTPSPEVHLLSNGTYHVALTNSGGGMSRYESLDVTRWREDPSRDHYGQFCYLRDVDSGSYWSATYQPTRREADKYQAVFSQGQVQYRCIREKLDVRTRVAVSPEDQVEVRQVTLSNLGRSARTLDLTTYAEVVLAPTAADRAHRAFSNLFVQTEWIAESQAILCTRRPRTPEESPPWMFHLLCVQGAIRGDVSCQTSREEFLGRTRSPQHPASMDATGPLPCTQGHVLDPIVSLRQQFEVAGDEPAVAYIITGVAGSREEALANIERYRDPRLATRVFDLSRAHSQLMLQQLGVTEADAQLYSRLASALLYTAARYRPDRAFLAEHLGRQDALWGLGISGDRPIAMVHNSDPEQSDLLRQMLTAHAYWRSKGLEADLVVWLDEQFNGRDEAIAKVQTLIASASSAAMVDKPGGVFVRRGDDYSPHARQTLEAAACMLFRDTQGSLEEQVDRPEPKVQLPPTLVPTRPAKSDKGRRTPRRRSAELCFFNGIGGFTLDGKEYIIRLGPDRTTPAPWCNVLANPTFGTVVSESGLGGTFSENAHEFRLTPWSNDPAVDPPGEAIYLRDEETGEFFSPTPRPSPSGNDYLCRHGFGYTFWEAAGLDLETDLQAFVSVDAPVKFLLLTVRNTSSRRRMLSASCLVEWVLGQQRSRTLPYIVTQCDPQSSVLLARNPFHLDFHHKMAFLHSSEDHRSTTCDRTELLGRNGAMESPAALRRQHLAERSGAGLDPAAAVQCPIELEPGQQHELVFVLGTGNDADDATRLAQRFGHVAAAHEELSRVYEHWNRLLGTITVETPDASLNHLANGWLVYQTLACRLWARSAFYQSSGAYGFRDQLQDVLALLPAAGNLTREHLLRAASRQFREGDVQHWWHPPANRGVRTRISDDNLWLPLVVAKYIDATGDTGVLDEHVPLLVERMLDPDEETLYSQPPSSDEAVSLYEHCRRAIRYRLGSREERGLAPSQPHEHAKKSAIREAPVHVSSRVGRHQLPLIGTGDWNDGFDRLGHEGRGESVWLAVFLIHILQQFQPLAEARGDRKFVELCDVHGKGLRAALDEHGWDGRWYRRAYTDTGEPLGTAGNVECEIDSLPQSWAVLAGAAPKERLREAMGAVYGRLVRPEPGLIQLFDPPFDRGPLHPGYIKGYPPGVRENGGQYTHAAIWVAIALARLGDRQRAWDCFRMINPIRHADSPERLETYRVEPYVMAADVYSVEPHVGRGGWTWYTGSAGWMYQLILEELLGVVRRGGNRLRFAPCPAPDWTGYRVHYRHGETPYTIEFELHGGPKPRAVRVLLDGIAQAGNEITLVDDRRPHQVVVTVAG